MGIRRRRGDDQRVLLDLDSRGRISLGALARGGAQRFFTNVEPDGAIVLTPAYVITETEARLLANPGLSSEIEFALTHPETLSARGRPKRQD